MYFELSIVFFGVISPTFFLAKLLKYRFKKKKYTVIRLLNWVYFLFSFFSFGYLLFLHIKDGSALNTFDRVLVWVWSVLLLSRCSEVFYAFLIDAYDKVKENNITNGYSASEKYHWFVRQFHNEKIEMHHRLALAFRSYIELVINFGILYSIQPSEYWKANAQPEDIVNALYFSGVTITTLGYGDITPIHWFPQFLTVYEVLCGFSLIVVCLAVYLSKK